MLTPPPGVPHRNGEKNTQDKKKEPSMLKESASKDRPAAHQQATKDPYRPKIQHKINGKDAALKERGAERRPRRQHHRRPATPAETIRVGTNLYLGGKHPEENKATLIDIAGQRSIPHAYDK